MSTSRSQITPHGNKTFTNPAETEAPEQSVLSCASTAPPGLQQEGTVFTEIPVTFPLHRASPHTLARSFPLVLIFLSLKLSTGRCEESQVRAVTLHFCSAFIPACGGSWNSPWFPGFLANAACTSKRSFQILIRVINKQ